MVSRVWDHLGSLLLALILGILVWVVALNEQNPMEERPLAQAVPVELIGPPEGMMLIGDVVKGTQVTIRAPRLVWEDIGLEDIHVTADISNLGPGTHQIDLERSIDMETARIVRLTPSRITVTLEEQDQREVSVDIELSGLPQTGYEADQPTVSDTHVDVSGPASAVARVSRVTARISVEGLRRDFNSGVALAPVDTDGNLVPGVTVQPDTVQLRVPITQKLGYREVAVKVALSGQVAAGYRLTNVQVTPLNVTLASPNPRLVEQMPGFVETQPLDLTDASDDIIRRLPLQLPEGVTVAGDDQTVLVQAFISAIEYTMTVDRPVEFRGLSNVLSAAASPDTVSVLISGPLPVLDLLTLESARVIVDVTGLGPGTYQVIPEVELLLDSLRADVLTPNRVEVTIVAGTPTPTPEEETLAPSGTAVPTTVTPRATATP